jgi:hypothetical protein
MTWIKAHQQELLTAALDALLLAMVTSLLFREPQAQDSGRSLGWLWYRVVRDIFIAGPIIFLADLIPVFLSRRFARVPCASNLAVASFMGAAFFAAAIALLVLAGNLMGTSFSAAYIHLAVREAEKVLFFLLLFIFVLQLFVRFCTRSLFRSPRFQSAGGK